MQSANSPLIGTPTRAQIYSQPPRIQQNPQATALLSPQSTDSETDEEMHITINHSSKRKYDERDYKDIQDNEEDSDDDDGGLKMRLS
jgi:hypothetical protein